MISPIQLGKNSSQITTHSLPSIDSIATETLSSIQKSLEHLNSQELTRWANSRNEKGMTPLAVAIEAHTLSTNRMDVMFFLIEKCKADPNIGDNDNWTPLYRASTGMRSELLKFLLFHGAKPNIPNKDGSVPLHRAIDRGSETDVKELLTKGAEVNIVNCFGSPLAYAAKNGNISIAHLLLTAGADPNLVNDPLGTTPAALAANYRKEEMKNLLLSKQGLEDVPLNSITQTPLSLLAHKESDEAILKSFVSGERDEYGRSAAHYCAHLGKVDLLKKMCIKGNIDLPDGIGRTPLHYAVMKGQESLVTYLMSDEGNCALDSRDNQGYTPLMWSCQFNRETIAKNILERSREKNMLKAVLSAPDNFGWKAIHKSAQVGNLALVRMLVEDYKIDHSLQLADGRLPVDIAKTTNSTDVINYLNNLNSTLADASKKA